MSPDAPRLPFLSRLAASVIGDAPASALVPSAPAPLPASAAAYIEEYGDDADAPAPGSSGGSSSLTASAARLTSSDINGAGKGGGGGGASSGGPSGSGSWQQDAWDTYDLVGEQRYLVSTLAARLAQARFFVAKVESTESEPVPSDDPRLAAVLAYLGSPAELAGRVERSGANLSVAGEVWWLGVPRRYLPGAYDDQGAPLGPSEGEGEEPDPLAPVEELDEETADTLEWRVLSSDELDFDRDGREATLQLESAFGSVKVQVPVEELFIMRIWRAHPRRAWEADSPTRSSLPVLRELIGLTMHISAQIDSRLAGAGILAIPASVSRALKQADGLPPDSKQDPFLEALMDAMITPITDRDSASALVPLVVTVPDAAPPMQHLSLASELSGEAREMREEAIKRFALGQDAPPELLLGTGSMNHWGSWLVREEVVETHLKPPLRLITDAWTRQYLRPMMRAMGYSEQAVSEHVITFSVEHMITRPNRGTDAQAIHAAGELSGEALRAANGFDETDAPMQVKKLDLALETALDMLRQAPSLAQVPGLPTLVAQLREILDGETPETPEGALPPAPGTAPAPAAKPAPGSAPPATDGDDAEPPALNASAASVGAAALATRRSTATTLAAALAGAAADEAAAAVGEHEEAGGDDDDGDA